MPTWIWYRYLTDKTCVKSSHVWLGFWRIQVLPSLRHNYVPSVAIQGTTTLFIRKNEGKFNSISFFSKKKFSYADHELLELAACFQSPPGRPAAVARRVRSVLRQDNKPRFVSAFCQSNCGDVSPNVLGAFCIDTGLPCDFNHSTCGGKNELCYGRGPGYLSLLPLRFFLFIFVYIL